MKNNLTKIEKNSLYGNMKGNNKEMKSNITNDTVQYMQEKNKGVNPYIPLSVRENKVLIVGDKGTVVNLDVVSDDGEFIDMVDTMKFAELKYNYTDINTVNVFDTHTNVIVCVTVDSIEDKNIDQVLFSLNRLIYSSDICVLAVNKNIKFVKSKLENSVVRNEENIESREMKGEF